MAKPFSIDLRERVLRVARPLADLEGDGGVTRMHVAEALSYRRVAPGR